MARKINISIDVTKLNKAKLFKGAKGTYANITLIEKKTEYGDWMVVEDLSKEERAKGDVKNTILGNGKNHGWGDNSGSSEKSKPAGNSPSSADWM